MSYIDILKKHSPITVDSIISAANENIPESYKSHPWSFPGLAHGTAPLTNEDQLCCYLAAYGNMHNGKLECAISQFPFPEIDKNCEIIDWGCGQGIASVAFVNALEKCKLIDKLQKVTLIEPSELALGRAKMHVQMAVGEDVYVETLNYFLPSIHSDEEIDCISGLHIEEPICIHLFSNILDIPDIDLKELSLLISTTGYRHYFVCVGPLNFGNERISSFERYFDIDKKNVFVDVRSGQYKQLANGKWYSCIAKGFELVREEGKPFLISLSYYPPKQFFAAYRLDEISKLDAKDEFSSAYWNKYSAFEVLAPFDIGASIYDDIDPILAVLSNIITRGLPTKCSPYIESILGKYISKSSAISIYGTISYCSSDSDIVKNNESLLRQIPLAIARIEKVIIEAILTGHLSLDLPKWDVLVKENDVPCAALAFEDLRQMFDHLSLLSREFCNRRFPKIDLSIISERYDKSPLHVIGKVFKSPKQVNKEKKYDLVIDVAIDETIDAVNVSFSEFKANNLCYFNVRSSSAIYSNREIYTTDRIQYKPLTTLNARGNYDTLKENVDHLVFFLQLIFRKENFRPGQLPILNRALQNKGVIGLLPTGGGKSLTYQLAAMLQPGITVIIDPLKSLMEDQYDGLLSAGIDCCTYINSELSKEEKAAHELMMETSQALFTFMSPERLCIYEFRERLQNMKELNVYFSYGVIDEVHCVSEWGQDFRFSYLHLGRNLYSFVRAKNGPISLFGLTATASFDVLSDVERELSGNGAFKLDPDTIVRYENSNRLELQYKVEKIEVEYKKDQYYDKEGHLKQFPSAVNIGDSWSTNDQKAEFLKRYISKIPGYLRELQTPDAIDLIVSNFQYREDLEHLNGDNLRVDMPDDFYRKQNDYKQAGIVFCPHVNSSGISVNVNSHNLSESCEVGTFAGSAQDGAEQGNESMKNMRRFRDNELPIMVATKAFGMGIDKPNVRFTINMNYSSSLESYVQEAGRAGRDRKMALSIIFVSDYHLVRINNKCPINAYPMGIIKGKWFKEDDLNLILENFGIKIDERYIDNCDPLSDIIKLKCNTDNIIVKDDKEIKQSWKCSPKCSKFSECQLRYVDKSYRGWRYHKDLEEYLNLNKIRIPRENIEYQGADYNTVMYFFDNNFKGEFEEKKKMHYLLSEKELVYFIGNDQQDKPTQHVQVNGFMETVLQSKPGTEIVSLVSYDDESYADIAKAIYRMCVIGLVDDFTQDYSKRVFRILSTRKKNGSYYLNLKDFLMRYYSEERAENEVEKASVRKGKNEIHKCLGYLTEFIYDKVALKRKRAIDDMRNFCLLGIDESKDWKLINEDLKEEIYYYFNSKYARAGYRTDNDEPFSLVDDTEKEASSFELVYKYMRVVDNDVIGTSGSPKDNIKHLHGAVRIIRRSENDINPTLRLLDVFCLLALKTGSNKNMQERLDKSYTEGYLKFKKQSNTIEEFYEGISNFKKELNSNGRNIASDSDLKHLKELEMKAELSEHLSWSDNFINKYVN